VSFYKANNRMKYMRIILT